MVGDVAQKRFGISSINVKQWSQNKFVVNLYYLTKSTQAFRIKSYNLTGIGERAGNTVVRPATEGANLAQ